jgi:hypothetical protein
VTRREDESLLSVEELASVLRAHEGPPEPIVNGSAKRKTRTTSRRSARHVALVGGAAAIALLIGSGLGFGLGSSVTPSGTARANVVGFGFLPARGWNVMQSGIIGPSGEARAIAANVALDPADDPRAIPLATLRSLPERGVVVAATFTPRGDAGEDFKFPVSELPLRLDTAATSPEGSLLVPGRRLGYGRLRAGVRGYNVDARIYFGVASPSAGMVRAVQQQLSRLVVGSDRVTIAARPAIIPWNGRSPSAVTLFGSVDNGEAGETVEIQAKDCGQSFFRAVAGATTVAGGGWSTEYFAGITTTLRAVWEGTASTQITVRHRAFASLRRLRSGIFETGVAARSSLWRKHMTIERFDRKLGTWRTIRTVVLTEQEGGGPSTFVGYSARFKLSVPKGTLLRSAISNSQVRPCYISGKSLPLRT